MPEKMPNGFVRGRLSSTKQKIRMHHQTSLG